MLVFLFTGHIVQHSALILCISADNSKAVRGPNSSVTKHAITWTFPPLKVVDENGLSPYLDRSFSPGSDTFQLQGGHSLAALSRTKNVGCEKMKQQEINYANFSLTASKTDIYKSLAVQFPNQASLATAIMRGNKIFVWYCPSPLARNDPTSDGSILQWTRRKVPTTINARGGHWADSLQTLLLNRTARASFLL